METPFMIGERIYLRPPRESDLPRFVRWFNDPEVRHTLAREYPLTEMAERKWFEELAGAKNRVNLVIVLRDGDRPIGTVGLDRIHAVHRKAIFGIAIGEKQYWDQGYGTEATRLMARHAFDTLNLHRIELHVYAFNPRAIRAYEKAGFVREGIRREAHAQGGRFHDIVVMGILEGEYREAVQTG